MYDFFSQLLILSIINSWKLNIFAIFQLVFVFILGICISILLRSRTWFHSSWNEEYRREASDTILSILPPPTFSTERLKSHHNIRVT
jgi:hypothetical protein